MNNQAENSCTASGCKALCCQNMCFTLSSDDLARLIGQANHFHLISPEVIPLYINKKPAQSNPTAPTIYYAFIPGTDGSSTAAYLHGRCPQLNSNDECLIHENPIRACQAFPFNEEDCKRIRRSRSHT